MQTAWKCRSDDYLHKHCDLRAFITRYSLSRKLLAAAARFFFQSETQSRFAWQANERKSRLPLHRVLGRIRRTRTYIASRFPSSVPGWVTPKRACRATYRATGDFRNNSKSSLGRPPRRGSWRVRGIISRAVRPPRVLPLPRPIIILWAAARQRKPLTWRTNNGRRVRTRITGRLLFISVPFLFNWHLWPNSAP